jgi:hypothetical protein
MPSSVNDDVRILSRLQREQTTDSQTKRKDFNAIMIESRGDDETLLSSLYESWQMAESSTEGETPLQVLTSHLATIRHRISTSPPSETITNLSTTFWKYTKLILEKQPDVSASILLPDPQEIVKTLSRVKTTVHERQMHSSRAKAALLPNDAEYILEQLSPYGDDAIIPFLDRLIAAGNDTNPIHHTQLAEALLRTVSKDEALTQEQSFVQTQRGNFRISFSQYLAQSSDVHAKNRLRLLRFLQQSTRYDAQLILDSTNLTPERASCLGRLGKHHEALDLLVHKLKDLIGAESYCKHHSAGENLFLALLHIYLGDANRDALFGDIIHILRHPDNHLQASQVLNLIPEYWSLDLLSDFLSKSFSRTMHRHHQGRIEKSLQGVQNLRTNSHLVEYLRQTPVLLTDKTTCSVCGRLISDGSFVRLPNSSLAHINCK